MSTRGKTLLLLAVIAVSTPFALVVETVMRELLFPPDFELVREWLRPTLTRWAWVTPPLAAAFTLFGLRLHNWYAARQVAKLPQERRTPDAVARAHFDALILSTSMPQIPALLATFAFMMGASVTPVVVAMVVATAGVLTLGWLIVRRQGDTEHEHDPDPDPNPKS